MSRRNKKKQKTKLGFKVWVLRAYVATVIQAAEATAIDDSRDLMTKKGQET